MIQSFTMTIITMNQFLIHNIEEIDSIVIMDGETRILTVLIIKMDCFKGRRHQELMDIIIGNIMIDQELNRDHRIKTYKI